jgi:predicted DNA-binding WGR domain protein
MPPKRKVTVEREVESDEVSESEAKRFKTTEGNEILHYLICKEGGSDKFYEISIKNNSVLSRYGRNGSNGVTSVKDFDTLQQAREFVDQIRHEKLRKGYRETAIPASSVTNSSLATVKARVISHTTEPDPTTTTSTTATSSSTSSNPSHRTVFLESGNIFYEMKINGLSVDITTGTKDNRTFSTEDALQTFLTNSVGQKLDEGYELVDILTRASSTITLSRTTAEPVVKTETEEVPTDDDTVISEVITTRTPATATIGTSSSTSTSTKSTKYYLECKEGNSYKYYELVMEGTNVTIRYGRIGAPGNPTTKDFPRVTEK